MPNDTGVTLGLDTSGGQLLVAARRGGKKSVRRVKGIQQERLLFKAVQAVLHQTGGTLAEVKKISLVRGPGRFTGIRIALTFASMMQQLNGACVYGITLFDLIHRQVQDSPLFRRWKKEHTQGAVAVVLHAFREEYFLQIFDATSQPPRWLSREELLQQLAAYRGALLVAGNGKPGESLAQLTQNMYALAAEKDCHVRPEVLLALAQDESLRPKALEPLYLKPARFEMVSPR